MKIAFDVAARLPRL